jgi:hypothetical protein
MDEQDKMRVAVAQDVLDRLEFLTLRQGHYLKGSLGSQRVVSQLDNAQNHLDLIENNCGVCALGACVLSYVRIYDDVTMSEIGYKLDWDGEPVIRSTEHNIQDVLKRIFSVDQMVLIESAFECENMSHQYFGVYRWPSSFHNSIRRAEKFGLQYRDKFDRVEAIMKNIIENEGEFIPGDTVELFDSGRGDHPDE